MFLLVREGWEEEGRGGGRGTYAESSCCRCHCGEMGNADVCVLRNFRFAGVADIGRISRAGFELEACELGK